MTLLDKTKIDEILHMYKPDARYLLEANIDFPILEGKLWFRNKPIYLVEASGIQHINNTETTMISNQAAFLLYREAVLRGKDGFPYLSEEEIKRLYDSMFIKKQNTQFKQFVTLRVDKAYNVRVEHRRVRKTNGVYFVWYDLSIDDFLDSEVIGGIKL